MALEVEKDETSARFVKGRLERTTLGQVSRSIRIVLGHAQAHVEVTLDSSTIDKLQVGGSPELAAGWLFGVWLCSSSNDPKPCCPTWQAKTGVYANL